MFGERIRNRRLELDMTQEELATKLGYRSKSSINKIELGINDIPLEKVSDFASALKTTDAFLMGWTNDPYDYDNDPEGRTAALSGPQWEYLLEKYDCDVGQAYSAYSKLQEATAAEAMQPNTIAAHHDAEDWTEEELAEIEEFKKYVRSKRHPK